MELFLTILIVAFVVILIAAILGGISNYSQAQQREFEGEMEARKLEREVRQEAQEMHFAQLAEEESRFWNNYDPNGCSHIFGDEYMIQCGGEVVKTINGKKWCAEHPYPKGGGRK